MFNFHLSTPSLLDIVIVYHLKQTDSCVKILNCGFNLHFPRTRKVNPPFQMFIYHFNSLVCEMPVHVFYPFSCLTGLSASFLLVLGVIYIFCTRVLCQMLISQIFPSTLQFAILFYE